MKRVHEAAGHFGYEELLYRHCFRHLTEPVSDDEKVLIPPLTLDELPEYDDAH